MKVTGLQVSHAHSLYSEKEFSALAASWTALLPHSEEVQVWGSLASWGFACSPYVCAGFLWVLQFPP